MGTCKLHHQIQSSLCLYHIQYILALVSGQMTWQCQTMNSLHFPFKWTPLSQDTQFWKSISEVLCGDDQNCWELTFIVHYFLVLNQHLWGWCFLHGEQMHHKRLFFHWQIFFNTVIYPDFHLKHSDKIKSYLQVVLFPKVIGDKYLVVNYRGEADEVGFVRWETHKV